MSILKPAFVRVEDAPEMLGVSVEAIRQGCICDYLPVYLDADGLKAYPKQMTGSVEAPVRVTRHKLGDQWVLVDHEGREVQRTPEFTLPQFWRVWNDAATESVDEGLAKASREVDVQFPIAHLATSDRDLDWFPGPCAGLVESKRVRFLDLYVLAEDVAPKNAQRVSAGVNSGKERNSRKRAAMSWLASTLSALPPKPWSEPFVLKIKRQAAAVRPATDATDWLVKCDPKTIRNYLAELEEESRK